MFSEPPLRDNSTGKPVTHDPGEIKLLQPLLHHLVVVVILDERLVDGLDHHVSTKQALTGDEIVQLSPGLVTTGRSSGSETIYKQ